jgi:hypothetical protein
MRFKLKPKVVLDFEELEIEAGSKEKAQEYWLKDFENANYSFVSYEVDFKEMEVEA